MRFQSRTVLLAVLTALALRASAQIVQPRNGESQLQVTPAPPNPPITSSLDVFPNCAPGEKSILSGPPKSVTQAGPVVLTLSQKLKAGALSAWLKRSAELEPQPR